MSKHCRYCVADYIRSKRVAALEVSCADDILTGSLSLGGGW